MSGIRLLVAGVDHVVADTLNRPIVDALTGSGYLADGSDFAGFMKLGASYTKTEADARFAPIAVPLSSVTGTTLPATVVTSSLTSVGILAAPHLTSPVVDSGGLTVTAGGLAVTGGIVSTDGAMTIGAPALGSSPTLGIDAVAGTSRQIAFRTAGVSRWSVFADTTSESGANAGSGFQIQARTDAGAAIDVPLSIVRAAGGTMTLSRPTLLSSGALGIGTSAGTSIMLRVEGVGQLASATNYGVWSKPTAPGGTTTALVGYYARPTTPAASVLSNIYGVFLDNAALGGSVTTQYGLFVQSLTGAAGSNFAIFTNTGLVSFGDATTVRSGGLTVTAGGLTVSAGGATITGATSNSVPVLKVTDGTVSLASIMGGGPNAQFGTTSNHPLLILANNAIAMTIATTGAVTFAGNVGFNGTAPVAKPALAAASTDLASVITLANDLRTRLINYGLAA